MKRRMFISGTTLAAAGWLAARPLNLAAAIAAGPAALTVGDLYDLFMNPGLQYRPFVRWWWNGNKVEAGELIRELHLLKEAGIGGVEVNPVEFPSRSEGDDMGIPSLTWLSREWTAMLKVVFDETKTLGMTCDLIVGSGWPFGAEDLPEEERSDIVVIAVKKLKGPLNYSITEEEIFAEADPAVSSPWDGRDYKLLSLMLVPDPLTDQEEINDLSGIIAGGQADFFIPEGDHALYGLVKVSGFMEVINGAPGASGPVLDHYNKIAVGRYLHRMSDTIEAGTGPLATHLRALFTDSMELEGANWTSDMRSQFIGRRGYDIFPLLPFVLFRTGAMGNVTDFNYGAAFGPEFEAMLRRMRYDFETTKAELLEERFMYTFAGWCKGLGVRSRMQAYGRGFYPLASSMAVDIPEGESWTMNWLKHRIGEEMPESDYRRGRAYTMVNKYVSSAAHLTGKRLISCEEMTDTYTVFNTSLENLKTGSDQSIISGITHSIFHGFNYSPPQAPWPGWLRYGGYFNENNTWWPHFHLLNEYKCRLSAVLQNSDMYTDIGILPPTADMWSRIGMQNEPFPSILHAEYLSLVWEAIVKNGSGCDYVSDAILKNADIRHGYISYGPRSYNTLFLVQVESISPETAKKLLEFVASGGRVFCIETYPAQSPGWNDHPGKDSEVKAAVEEMKSYRDRFILLRKPESDFIGWYRMLQEEYHVKPYLNFSNPDPYLMQVRYCNDDGIDFIFIINSHIHEARKTGIVFSESLVQGRHCWIWNPENGKRYRVKTGRNNSLDLDIGPAESLLFAFDRESRGAPWKPLPTTGPEVRSINTGWRAEFRHCHDGSVKEVEMKNLADLRETPGFEHFAGTVIYRNNFRYVGSDGLIINLGKVYGTSELVINGKSCGVKWYGRRIFDAANFISAGENSIEVIVTTSMGNYMKSLTDNPVAQYWTNAGSKNQPLQSMGMTGPVTYYRK